MVPVETSLWQRARVTFGTLVRILRLTCKANHFTLAVKSKMSFGGEPTEKKDNNHECIEVYHLLLPENFKDKLWISSSFCLSL